MPKITPCLWFDDQGEEAAKFYTSVFPNSKITEVTHYGEAGPGPAGSVMTVSFVLDGHEFLALNGGPEFTFSEAISFQIDCHSQEEVDHYWNRLSEGGHEDQCGWVKDKFGLSWQVVPVVLPPTAVAIRSGDGTEGAQGHVGHEEARYRRSRSRHSLALE